MKTLASHYQKIKEKLKSRLDAVNTVEEVVIIVRDEINQLTDLNGEYIKELTPPQARLARNMLEGMKENIQILASVELQDLSVDIPEKSFDISEVQAELNKNILSPLNNAIQTQKNIQNWTSPDYYKQILLKPIQKSRVIVSSLLAAGIAGTLEGGITWGLVGAGIGLVSGGVFSQVVKQKQLSGVGSNLQQEVIQNQPKIIIDTNKLLTYLYQNFQSIDQTVLAYGAKEEKSSQPDLENNLDLLEYLQELMADALDAETQLPISVRRRIEQAITILRRYGIEAKVYQPDISANKAWDMFYFEPSIDPNVTDYVTLKHAFVKDEKVLLPGSVIEPSSTSN
jgi:predicted metal-dependent enzyme (double-stranded beta helix superfamily)